MLAAIDALARACLKVKPDTTKIQNTARYPSVTSGT
nr:antimicrobial peptide P1 [uncultured bacterium]